jgi:hypothetical protein
MTDLAAPNSTTHPVGWTFLGAGAAIWACPLARLLGFGRVLEILNTPLGIAALLFTTTLFGACLDFALSVTLERLLFRAFKMTNPEKDQWAAAWRTRWRSAGAETEFRRYEGMVSLARAYLVHTLLAGLLWSIVMADLLGTTLALILTALSAWLFISIWHRYTSLLLLIVRSAAAWETSGSHGAA